MTACSNTAWLHGWASSPAIWGELPTRLDPAARFANFANGLDAGADALLTPGCTLVGWSLGGMLAIAAAARHPDAVRRLVLISTTPRFTDAWPERVIRRMQKRLARDSEGTITDFQAKAGIPNAETDSDNAGLEYLATCDLRGELAALPCPVLWIHGASDPIIPATAVAPRDQDDVVILPELGHAPFLEDVDACECHIREFLA